jgi:hypothetical protein
MVKLSTNIVLIATAVASILSIVMSIFSIIDIDDTQSAITYKDIWRWSQTAFNLIKMSGWFLVWYLIFHDKESVLFKNQAYQKSIILFAVTSAIQFAGNLGNCFIHYGKGDWVKIVKTIIEAINIFLSFIDTVCSITIFTANVTGDSFDAIQKKSVLFKFAANIKTFGKEIDDEVRGNKKSEMEQQSEINADAFKSVIPGDTPEKAFGDRQKRRNPSKRRKKRK